MHWYILALFVAYILLLSLHIALHYILFILRGKNKVKLQNKRIVKMLQVSSYSKFYKRTVSRQVDFSQSTSAFIKVIKNLAMSRMAKAFLSQQVKSSAV